MDVQEIFAALLEPTGLADPYPLYAALHRLGEVIPAGGGMILVPGYEAASTILRDPAYLVPDADRLDGIFPGWREHPSMNAESLLNLNGEPHARIRGLMARQFTHRRVQALEPAIERLTENLLDGFPEGSRGVSHHGAPAGGVVDFMAEFAFALPVTVICELIGVPEQDRSEFRPLARSLTATLEPLVNEAQLAEADGAAIRLAEMFGALIARRRAQPGDDLLTGLVAACDVNRLSESELINNLILLLVAGFETTTNLLGNGLVVALADADVAEAVRSGRVPPAAFVEEVLRYDSPVQFTGERRPVAPAEINGVPVTPDDHVVVMTGAANRDPRRFAEPDRFWPERADHGPLSFGGGLHFCLGAALARLEGAVAFPRVLGRFPALALADEPERRAGIVLRGFERLPVSVR